MKMFIGLSAIWTALYLFGAVMEWLTQHDLLMPAFLMLVAAVAANALRAKLMGRMAMVALAMLLVPHAFARDLDGRYAQSPLKSWFDKLRSSGGSLCCSDADGTALSDVDWDAAGGHYRVRIDGEWIPVPDGAVIKEPNRAGRTMVWPYRADGKVLFIRCFIVGAMG